MQGKRMMLVAAVAGVFCVPGHAAADKIPEQFVMEAKAVITEVSVTDVKKMLDAGEKIILLNVTEKDEFAAEHIAGSINVTRGKLEFMAASALPDKGARIVVYCGTDRRSPLATRTLNELGYRSAVNMTGGLDAWKAAGFPVERKKGTSP